MILIDFAAPVTVSTLTTLLPMQRFSTWPTYFIFCVVNLDLTNTVTVVLETSEDGVSPDAEQIILSAPPGKQASTTTDTGRGFYRLSAHTDSPGFPTAQVKFCVIRGVPLGGSRK